MKSVGSFDSLIDRLSALPVTERAALLDQACIDNPDLEGRRKEIAALLAANGHAARQVGMTTRSRSSVEGALRILNCAFEATDLETEGLRIGSYKLMQKIGEGGFGVVWMAEQQEPIRRRVALKILKSGMDTKEVIARFGAERQALALMEHPNIAQVFDAGATSTGRPYFVMELVRGIAITRYCDDNRLTPKARLELFISVCQAVQHAHQKGVVHRDLKPSNILVTLNDGVPVPKIIDFGIAKATGSQLTDKTVFTLFHAFLGTPAYTSPEQMEMSGLDVDTRSDIYSLGVLLYELLTGRPPFDPDALAKSGLEAMRRTLREVDPPRPSSRLSTLSDADRTTVGQQRGTDCSRLSLLLRGDLDWIVMRCLEKDRTRRYETASGLAMDVQRHLATEPVTARPPSTLYRVSKFVRRHKLGVASAASLAALLLTGLLVSSFLLMRERAAHSRAVAAEHAEGVLRRQAEEARATEAIRASRTARELATQLFTEGRTAEGLAYLVHAARKDPGNLTLGPRLASAITLRNFLLPVQAPLKLPDQIVHLNYIEGGRRIAIYAEDGTTAFIDAATGSIVRTKLPSRIVSDGVLLNGLTTLIHGEDGVIRVLDSSTGQIKREFTFEKPITWVTARNPDHPFLLVSLNDGTSIVADTFTGSLRVLPFPIPQTSQGSISADGRWLARSVKSKRAWELWDLRTGELRGTQELPGEQQRTAFSLDGAYVVTLYAVDSAGYGFRVWSTPDAKPVTEPQVISRSGNSAVLAPTFSPDGRWLCITTPYAQQVFEVATGTPVGPPMTSAILSSLLPADRARSAAVVGYNGLSGGFRGPIFCGTQDQPCLITKSDVDGEGLVVRDLFTGKTALPLLKHPVGIADLRLSEDGTTLLTIGDDGSIRLWDLLTARLLAEPGIQLGMTKLVVALSPDGRELTLSGSEGVVYRMKVGRGAARPLELPRSSPFVPAPFLAESPSRILWIKSDRAEVVDVASGKNSGGGFAFPEPIAGGTEGRNFAIRKDLRFIVTRTAAGTWQTWERDQNGGMRAARLEDAPAQGGWICLGENSDVAAITSDMDSKTLAFWNLRSGRKIGSAMSYPTPIFAGSSQPANFSSDGKRFVAGDVSGTVRIWDTSSGVQLAELHPMRKTWTRWVDFGVGDTRVATQNNWGEVQLWEASTGRPVAAPISARGALQGGLAFSPSSESLLTWSVQGDAQVWDARSGAAIGETMQHPYTQVRWAAFSHDSERVATAGVDGAARIWHSTTGQQISEPMWHDARVVDCEFSPDQRFLRTEQASVPPKTTKFFIWSVPPREATGPVPDWLLQLATLCATKAVNESAQCVEVPEVLAEMVNLRAQLAALPNDAPFVEWGRWVFDDRPERPIAPGFTITETEAEALKKGLAASPE